MNNIPLIVLNDLIIFITEHLEKLIIIEINELIKLEISECLEPDDLARIMQSHSTDPFIRKY